MLQRCDPKKCIRSYSARGITACPEWRADFWLFYSWALSNGYADGLTIDRIDNNGNYEPSNCRWIPPALQQRNKSTNRIIVAFGESKTVADWGEDPRCRVNVRRIYHRLQLGWPPELAITTLKMWYGNQRSGKNHRLLIATSPEDASPFPEITREIAEEKKKGRKR